MAYEEVLIALSDPTRRLVFEALRHGPKPVAEIAAGLPVSRPAVSQHLKVLAEAGLVRATPRGARRYYAIRPEGLGGLRAWMDGIWAEALGAFAAEAAKGGDDDSAD